MPIARPTIHSASMLIRFEERFDSERQRQDKVLQVLQTKPNILERLQLPTGTNTTSTPRSLLVVCSFRDRCGENALPASVTDATSPVPRGVISLPLAFSLFLSLTTCADWRIRWIEPKQMYWWRLTVVLMDSGWLRNQSGSNDSTPRQLHLDPLPPRATGTYYWINIIVLVCL